MPLSQAPLLGEEKGARKGREKEKGQRPSPFLKTFRRLRIVLCKAKKNIRELLRQQMRTRSSATVEIARDA